MAGMTDFTGGGGKDTFYFSGSSDRDFYSDFGKGNDTIELFATSCDTFAEIKSRLTQDGKNTVLNFGDGEIMTFLNFDKDDFVKSDFEFIY